VPLPLIAVKNGLNKFLMSQLCVSFHRLSRHIISQVALGQRNRS
jgi:hypothetical protein